MTPFTADQVEWLSAFVRGEVDIGLVGNPSIGDAALALHKLRHLRTEMARPDGDDRRSRHDRLVGFSNRALDLAYRDIGLETDFANGCVQRPIFRKRDGSR